MFVSLIICTYKRPEAVQRLLESIIKCALKPDVIILVDGSPDDNTKNYILSVNDVNPHIYYYKVPPEHRGLTLQRNFGVTHLPHETDIVLFLDDDLVLEPDYFEKLLETYELYPDAIGIGGIDLKNNGYFRKQEGVHYSKFNYYELDGWAIREPLRSKARKLFGLMPSLRPGLIPEYSNGRSSFPPNGKVYEVEHFMGGISSYRMKIFGNIKFSNYFEGYGLYEDFDFCVRALPYGKLFVNTNAKVWHYHESSGRPDLFKYGKMFVKNGWYVWRARFPNPSIKARLQWHAIIILLTIVRLLNVITGPDRTGAFFDFQGRIVSWVGLWFKRPQILI